MNSNKVYANGRHVIVFGCGPTTHDDRFPVMAPGARTWQIVVTVAAAISQDTVSNKPRVTVVGLEPTAREGYCVDVYDCAIDYHPITFEDLISRQRKNDWSGIIDTNYLPDAVVGCASLQPCATAAAFAEQFGLPLWEDIFGDPIAEMQSKTKIDSGTDAEKNNQYNHVRRLLMTALLRGDRFSSLSTRQRFCLLGQLGCAGRLNRHTVGAELVHSIPYGIFPDADPVPSATNKDYVTVMWCGSFNTWMDPATLTDGIMDALRKEPRLRMMIVGGGIPQYNESSYITSIDSLHSIPDERLIIKDWQSLAQTRELYSQCDAGLCIDCTMVEAILGSRTRIVNFMNAGLPVVSTVLTELTETLANANLLIPFEVGSSAALSATLTGLTQGIDLAELGKKCQTFVRENYDALTVGKPLMDWVSTPTFAPDRNKPDNQLKALWQSVI